jgi:N-acetylneuraminic acid mutarotase
MKTTSLLVVALLFSIGTASVAVAQTPASIHNKWTTGTPMPTATSTVAVGVIGGQVYVVGGGVLPDTCLADTQIYDPATNTWSAGAPLPVGTCNGASAAVVNNILYVFGGGTATESVTNAVWAYNPQTDSWSSMSPMPTAKGCSGTAAENGIVYVVGGCGENPQDRLTDVESYNPATDTWTEEAPLLVGKSQPSVGLVGTTIVAADGFTASGNTGDNEGYDATTNSWTALPSDPRPRNGACTGAIGTKLYVGDGNTKSSESFNLSKNKWHGLAHMPQPATFAGGAVYGGQLFCFGGIWGNDTLNNVQIYQP